MGDGSCTKARTSYGFRDAQVVDALGRQLSALAKKLGQITPEREVE
jgi:hypothetical protein